MTVTWIYAPILVIIVQIFTLLIYTASKRFNAVKSRQIEYKVIQNVVHHALPQNILLAGRSYDNQFQLPVLFIILLVFLALNEETSSAWVAVSWLFVMLRLWHMSEHLSARNIKMRTCAFALSAMLLCAMWLTCLISQLL